MLKANNSRTDARKDALKSALALSVVVAMISVVLFELLSPVLLLNAAKTNTVNTISATLHVPGTCVPVVDNVLVSFEQSAGAGYVQPGRNAPTANAVNVIDQGNTGSNIIVYGVNWIASTAAFWVSNTLFSATKTSGGATGVELANIATAPSGQDSNIPVQANGKGNVIFFGLNVPVGQAAGTYNQLITVSLQC